MPDDRPPITGGRRRLRFTRLGLSIGVAASAAILFVTFMLYLPGTQTQADATSAGGAALIMAMFAGFPTSFASVPFARDLSGMAAWLGIAGVPILNGVVLGAAVDIGSAFARRTP